MVGGVVGVVLVGGGCVGVDVVGRLLGTLVGRVVGTLVGTVVGTVVGAVGGTVGGRSVTAVVGPVVSTICGVGVPVVIAGSRVVARPVGNWISPGLVAVGNGVCTALGVVLCVGEAVRGMVGRFCVGRPGSRPATGLAGCGPLRSPR